MINSNLNIQWCFIMRRYFLVAFKINSNIWKHINFVENAPGTRDTGGARGRGRDFEVGGGTETQANKRRETIVKNKDKNNFISIDRYNFSFKYKSQYLVPA